jgi:murein DD-endopeptidase MepM/ murein hydrolase activator NlpD
LTNDVKIGDANTNLDEVTGLMHPLRLRVRALFVLIAVILFGFRAPGLEARLVDEDIRDLHRSGIRVVSTAAIATTMETYRIRSGDTLWAIARQRNLDVKTVAELNHLSLNSILRVGQQLHLPTAPRRAHRVLAGQTLWRIARLYGVTVEEIMRLNNIDSVYHLRVGQTLLLPATSLKVADAGAPEPSSRSLNLFSWPLVGVITSGYGLRHGEMHHGIDIAAPTGTPIKAARAGTVVYAGWRSVYGRTVIVDHGDGTRALYGHASAILVRKGQKVKAGQSLARVGKSGRATGPHLHFELHQGERTVNPLAYLKR